LIDEERHVQVFVRDKAEAARRARKLARKKMQREGLLPMKPRLIPGTAGRRGPARTPRSDLEYLYTTPRDEPLGQELGQAQG